MSWLDLVPVSTDAYAFQAALLCEDCGQALADHLREKGTEDDGDSGNFPQGPYPDGGGESDSTQFCDRHKDCVNAVEVAGHKVGCPLGNPLTTYGAESLREAIVEDMFSRKKYSQMLSRLLRRVWGPYAEQAPSRVKPRYADKLPESLLRLCKEYHSRHTGAKGFHSQVFADSDHAYLLYETSLTLDLCRSEVSDEGEFADFEVFQLPIGETRGHSFDEIVASAVSDMVWD